MSIHMCTFYVAESPIHATYLYQKIREIVEIPFVLEIWKTHYTRFSSEYLIISYSPEIRYFNETHTRGPVSLPLCRVDFFRVHSCSKAFEN